MALKHAVLASLLSGEASGYDLAKRMNVSVANFWHATSQQIYSELARLETDGLVNGRTVVQRGKPNKRLFAISDDGREALAEYTREPARPTAIKDELLVKVQAADFGDAEAVAEALDARAAAAEIRLAVFDAMLRDYLRDGNEREFLASAERIGPYLNLRRGRDFEADNIAWYRWAAHALRARAGRPRVRRVAATPV